MWSNWWFFDFFSKTTLTILMKLGQNVEEINPESLAKTACQNFHRFQRYSTAKGRLGGPSMDRTRKILDPKIFFSFLESRYFNSWKKRKIGKSKIFSLYEVHPGLTLEKFFDKFFEKWKFFEKVSKWSNSQSYHVKSEIWRHSKNFPLLGHQSWRLSKFSKS